jgi:ribonuclease III
MLRDFRVWFDRRKLDDASRSKIESIERLTGTTIGRPQLFLRAMRHRSKLIETNLEHSESYEQLEFLGDAVLDLIVTEIIFEQFPSKNEGFMTQMRSRLVKGETLAEFAHLLDLPSLIEVGDRVKDQGIEQSSSVLADIFEALIGAIYRDSGYDAVRRFVQNLFLENIDFEQLESEKDNYKSILLEYAQAKKMSSPLYEVIDTSGPDHDRTFEIQVTLNGKAYGKGVGKNKKKAEQIAAQLTLEMLKKSSNS